MRYLIIILFFISCSSPNKYSLTGNIELEDNEKVFLVQMKDNRPLLIDSTSVKNGQFKFSVGRGQRELVIGDRHRGVETI